MTQTPRILAAAIGFATAFGASAASFQNGSFEANTLANPVYEAVTGAGVTGWTAVSPGFEWFAPSTYGGGLFGAAQDGTYAVDLAYVTSATGGGIRQTFDTVVDTPYVVSFAAGTSTLPARDGTGIVKATVDTTSETSFSVNLVNPGVPIAWQTYSFSFVATGASTTLTLLNEQNALQHFAFVDAVQVTAVPEPHEWAMMATGLALVGWIARRRRGIPGVEAARA